jgi:hypothetical protein
MAAGLSTSLLHPPDGIEHSRHGVTWHPCKSFMTPWPCLNNVQTLQDICYDTVSEQQPHRKESEARLYATHQAGTAPRVRRRWLTVCDDTLHHRAQGAGTCHPHMPFCQQRRVALYIRCWHLPTCCFESTRRHLHLQLGNAGR